MLIEKAAQRLGQDRRPILDRIVECDGGDWYLREKIVKAPDDDALLDNSRPLKYAFNFLLNGAQVGFVREGAEPTPDLIAGVKGVTFYVEVRKFRMGIHEVSEYPVNKIVDAITQKRNQLPNSEVGFVAIDNFDLTLEPTFGYGLIKDGLREVERLSRANPEGWGRPSGVILATASTMGSGPVIDLPPHLVWTNPSAEPSAPTLLIEWLVAALPNGESWRDIAEDGQ